MIKEAIATIGKFALGTGIGVGMGLFTWVLGVSMSAKACTQATEQEREELKKNCDRLDRTILEMGE